MEKKNASHMYSCGSLGIGLVFCFLAINEKKSNLFYMVRFVI